MPNYRLERLSVRRDQVRVYRWDDDDCVRMFCGVATVPSDHAKDVSTHSSRRIDRVHEINADTTLETTSAH